MNSALVVGGGGREHALAWALGKDFKKVYWAPGNAGAASLENCENVDISATNINALANFAEDKKIDLTVVGPEGPLVEGEGIVNLFEGKGLKIFGPRKEAAIIESSKAFSSELCEEYRIPAPRFRVFHSYKGALRYVEEKWSDSYKIVPKGDGLAGGKAAIVCNSKDEAREALRSLMVARDFGDAGDVVVLQERLYGPELSEIGISDGFHYMGFANSQDHKPIGENDEGPNTGGMGAYSPAPIAKGHEETIRKIMITAIGAMRNMGRPYKGSLYGALMIIPEGSNILEFNARFGDPEEQPVIMRMKSSLAPYLIACIEENLGEMEPPEWDPRPAVCVVLASGGYPGKYEKNKLIKGLDEVAKFDDVFVFHAGTALKDGKVYTSGGRVLGVTALGRYENDFRGAIDRAYDAVDRISFEGMYCRKDIGKKALRYD